MDIRKQFGTNKRAEEQGVWVDIGQGARVLIARKTSAAYRKKLTDTLRPYRGALQANAMEDRRAQELLASVAAGTILLGWDGIEADGKPLPFSVDAAERLMIDMPDFYRTIDALADDAGLFRAATEDAEQKNSPTGSVGI